MKIGRNWIKNSCPILAFLPEMQTREINTIVSDLQNIASLSSNEVTLKLGIYEVEAHVSSNKPDLNRISLFDGTSDIIFGNNNDSSVGLAGTTVNSTLKGIIQSDGVKKYSIRQYFTAADANGLGMAINNGDIEVYLTLIFRKIG